jgi:hypothetical protein
VVDLERRAKLQTVGTVVALIVLVAAGGWLLGKVIAADDNSRSEAAATTTTTAPVDPEAATKAEIEEAYRAYLAMQIRLQLAPNADDPEIPRRAAGTTLNRIRSALADLASKGQVIRVGPATSQTILSIDVTGDQATLTACFVDESGVFDAATGAEIVPMHIGTEIDRTVLEREGGTWRVSSRKAPNEGEVWEGETTCDR